MNASFSGPLRVEEVGPRRWRTLEPLVYRTPLFEIVIPAGSETDFASVPRPLWWLLPASGLHTRAAVLHDWLYRRRALPRVLCDALFMVSMKDLGVPAWQRWTMYLGVRLGGAGPYARGA